MTTTAPATMTTAAPATMTTTADVRCENLEVTYYVDGLAVDSQIACVLSEPATCTGGTTTSGENIQGMVGHVVLYQDALTSTEVANVASNTVCGSDTVAPTVHICLSCDNAADPTRATLGSVINVHITADEPVTIPTVNCNGAMVTFTTTGPLTTDWFGSFVVVQDATDTGNVICTVTNFADSAGNVGSSTSNINGAMDSCWVIVDPFAVEALYCVMTSNAEPNFWVPGDVLTATFTFNTTVLSPTIICNGAQFMVNPALSGGCNGYGCTTYTATFTATSSLPTDGFVMCSLPGLQSNTGGHVDSLTLNPIPICSPERMSASPSVSASASPSASPSVSPSASASPSASPSVSYPPIYQMATFNEDGACTSAGCTNLSPDDPFTSRIMLVAQRVMPLIHEPNCVADGGVISGSNCVTHLDPATLLDWSLSDIDLFSRTSTPVGARVLWKAGFTPAVTPTNVYPNSLLSYTAIAGVANCSLTATGTTYRVGWKLGPLTGGPCINDAIFGGYRCVAQGLNAGLSNFVDSLGVTMPTGTRYKDLLCPDVTGL